MPAVVDELVNSIVNEPRMKHLNRVYLPSRDEIVECIGLLQQILFPGYFGKQGLTTGNITYRIGELVTLLSDKLYEQVRHCLRYRQQIPGEVDSSAECVDCDLKAAEIVSNFFDRIPAVRQMLSSDVQAAFDGDPADVKEYHVDWDASAAEKDGFPWFMAKEIAEQPRAVADSLRGRLDHTIDPRG